MSDNKLIACLGCGRFRPRKNQEVTCRVCETTLSEKFADACGFVTTLDSSELESGIAFFRAMDQLLWPFAAIEEETS
jgi:hypothetical protein